MLTCPESRVCRVSPMKRTETYGRNGREPMRISVFTCAYENRSFHRVEYMGKIQAVVRNRAKVGLRLCKALPASAETAGSELLRARSNHFNASRSFLSTLYVQPSFNMTSKSIGSASC